MAFTQEQVNNWFTANPNATPEFVAQTVQGLGGLEANQGLAGLIGQHYGTDANTITSNYNTLTAPAATATPVVQAAPIAAAAQAVTAPITTPVATAPPAVSQFQTNVNTWKANNPTATPQQVANAIAANGGLTPEMAQAVANAYSTDVNTITSGYDRLNPYSQIASLYENKDYTGLNSLIGQSGLNTSQIQQHFGLNDDQLAQARGLGVNLNYTTPEIQSLVNGSLGNAKLQPWEQVNNIIETGQKNGFGRTELENLYGKDKVAAALDTYKGGINSLVTDALSNKNLSTDAKYGVTHGLLTKYGTSIDDLVTYGGFTKEQAQSLFDNYDKGLGNVVAKLADPKLDDITKTQTALALINEWGASDEDMAKASKGKYTTADVKAYLDPVRNVPTNFQKLLKDPNASAADITKFVTDAKKDPRTDAIYGAGLDKNMPDPAYLALRDINNGTGSLAENYTSFLEKAKSTPELATKYAKEIAQAEKMLGTAMFSANEVYGGKPQDYQLQIVSKLPAKALEKIPQQLEMTPAKIETRTGSDEGGEYKYNVEVPPTVKSKDVVPIGGGSDWEGGSSSITGYRSTKPTTINGSTVYATWDANGKITGYEGDSRQRSWLDGKHSISGNWDANGNPKVASYTSKGGGLRGEVNDIMSDPIMGSIANIAASYFGGPLGIAALGLVQGKSPEDIAKGMAISYAGGQIGQGVTGATGNALGEFGSQAAGQFAGNTAAGLLSGQGLDINSLLVNSLINAGIQTGGKDLLGIAGLDNMGAAQPYVNNLLSGTISGAITGNTVDPLKNLTSTAMKEAMKSGKAAAKTANVP